MSHVITYALPASGVSNNLEQLPNADLKEVVIDEPKQPVQKQEQEQKQEQKQNKRKSKWNLVVSLIAYAFAIGTIVLLGIYGHDELNFKYLTGDQYMNDLKVGIPVVVTCICGIVASTFFGLHFHAVYRGAGSMRSCGILSFIPFIALIGVGASSTVAFAMTCNYSHSECFNTRQLYVVNLIYFFGSCAATALVLIAYFAQLCLDITG